MDISPHSCLAGDSLVPTQKSSDCFCLNRHLSFSLSHNQLLNFSEVYCMLGEAHRVVLRDLLSMLCTVVCLMHFSDLASRIVKW